MKKIHTPNHKLYEQYYLDQAKQVGGNLPAFHGARSQKRYGLGSIFKTSFPLGNNTLKQGVKAVLHKEDTLARENLKTATSKRVKQAVGDMSSQNSSQLGARRKAT